MTKIIGVIPARMGSGRFPGKPLFHIAGMPMLEHVWHRAKMYKKWDELLVATCDIEIKDFADSKNIPCIMTSDKHERALDRVAEAIEKSDFEVTDGDIVLNVQGDEPMMRPDMITATVQPMIDNLDVNGVVLSMPIIDETQFKDPNALKIIHNIINRRLLQSTELDLHVVLQARRVAPGVDLEAVHSQLCRHLGRSANAAILNQLQNVMIKMQTVTNSSASPRTSQTLIY